MKRIPTVIILLVLMLVACSKKQHPETEITTNTHIKYFGFTLIDTFWDDPTDSETKTNYAEEVYRFSNLADLLVISPTEDIVQRVETFTDYDMKAVIHLHELFFEWVDTNSLSGANFHLREDYANRWEQFRAINESVLNEQQIAAFYVGEEPTWNGITYEELHTVVNLLEENFPAIPTMIIEAYPALNGLQVPKNADWVGFDHYFIKDPTSHAEFQQEWQTLRSKLSDPAQRIVLVMDSHYIDWAHGDFGKIALNDMDDVSRNYYELAKRDTNVIGIIGYFWPNGFDFPEALGARGMPEHVKAEYKRIGKEISGKQ